MQPPKAWTAVVLAAVAGFVDAFAYSALAEVLVAHLSGDTATTAIHAAQHAFREAGHRLLPIPGFMVGVSVGRMLSDVVRKRRARSRLAWVLGLELACLAAFALTLAPAPTLALLLAAAAMGVQNAAVRHVVGHEVRTTFVTGMLVALADESIDAFLHRRDARRPFVMLHLGVWLAFGGGAFVGAVAWLRWGGLAAVIAIAALALIIARDLVSPVAPQA